ncbi:hypothetical protein [uncultured Methanobrevibacter sp.]|uniref:hypothetical protein n=1 Tax=uncultured Methanobrevibacter sp. TaxID=253161 RepID=UPI00261B6456|nr:hypothetical protein [uncultured Methanobrevibacter sp.]
MADINELAEKKLKSRIRKIKKCNKDETEKQKFFDQLGTSFEIFFPNKKPEELSDSLIIWTTPEGKVIDAEYSYEIPENEEFTSIQVSEKDLKVILESLEDFKFELSE